MLLVYNHFPPYRCHSSAAPHAFSLAAPLLSDYSHSAWGAAQGAPVDVLKFAQGKDGWLWIATATGLYRYDGVHFEHSDSVASMDCWRRLEIDRLR